MTEGFIFDLDGVIVDTARLHFRAWKRLADSLGIPFTETDNERLKGVSRMRCLDILLAIGGRTPDESEKLAFADRKNQWYLELIGTLTPADLLPGATEFLELVRAAGGRCALGSASRNAPAIVERLGIRRHFDAVVDGSEVGRTKPDPEVFLLCARRLDLEPRHCVVFEDAEAGVAAAHAGGMRAVGIGSPATLGAAEIVVPRLGVDDRGLLAFLGLSAR